MIQTHDLGKQFDGLWAVDGISLQVGAGEVLALLGPNGAGKTTTVRMLTSVLPPSRGQAVVAGFDIVREASQVRSAVGVLTEQHGLYGRMPADDYLDFFGQLYGLERLNRQARVKRWLEQFGLWEERRRRIGEYSKGMRQKLALARALLHDPPVLLLDEPTSAMDPESARMVRDAIIALRTASRTIVICTHNLAEAEQIADQIAIIHRGRIVAQGKPGDLKRRMLGPPEFELQAGESLNGYPPDSLPGMHFTAQGDTWLRFKTDDPAHTNPRLLQLLVEKNIPVVSLHEVPRSLEQIYLQAIGHPDLEVSSDD